MEEAPADEFLRPEREDLDVIPCHVGATVAIQLGTNGISPSLVRCCRVGPVAVEKRI